MPRPRFRHAVKPGEISQSKQQVATIPFYRVALVLVAFALVLLQFRDSPFACTTTCEDDCHKEKIADPKLWAPLSPLYTPKCPQYSPTQGGVYVFIHLPKAGGTTIRTLFREHPPQETTVTLERVGADFADDQVRQWLVNTTETRNLLVEFHDGGNPSVPKLEGYLKDWRQLAALHSTRLFVFTLVREPISYAVSYFTYMNVGTSHHRYTHRDGSGRTALRTQEDLLEFTLPAPQCLYFARGEKATTNEFSIYGSQFDPTVECPRVYQVLTKYMDWIGTMETMQEQTLPLLTYLTSNNPEIGRSLLRQNTQRKWPEFLSETYANNNTMKVLTQRVAADQQLYQQVQRDYPWTFWKDCFENSDKS